MRENISRTEMGRGVNELCPDLAKLAFRAAGAAEIHYAPSEDLETIDITMLREATKQIDMAAYVLTDRAVIEALRQAGARGVKVRIWRDANRAKRVGDVDV